MTTIGRGPRNGVVADVDFLVERAMRLQGRCRVIPCARQLRPRSLSPALRYDVLEALSLGPSESGGSMTGKRLDDKTLRKYWNEWAKDARRWSKSDYAYWRYRRRFSLGRAMDRAYDEFDAQEERWRAEASRKYDECCAKYAASLASE